MRFNNLFLTISVLLILLLSISMVSASNNSNNTAEDVILKEDLSIDQISSIESVDELCATNDENVYSVQNDENIVSTSSTGKTIVVHFDVKQPNEVLWPKIQPAIDDAQSGDTVIIKGSPVHCHLTISKQLHVIGEIDGSIDACPHHTHNGLDAHGVFYVTEGGSGSVIEGFNFNNNDKSETPFAIMIDGASDVTIKDCTINYVKGDADDYVGIIIKNANNIALSNLLLNKTIYGITIINSSNVDISGCTLANGHYYGITVDENSDNINIIDNSIVNNGNSGINLSCANNVNILNNFIENNGLQDTSESGCGIYVNTNITKLVVKGNFFISNGEHAILYDYRCRNLNNQEGADLLTDVDNNYFEGHKSMILHHRIYVENSQGNVKYDADNDVYGSQGNGSYIESKSYVYMKYALIYNDVPCGFTWYTTKIPWSLTASANGGKYNFTLKLNLIQTKNGVYQVSIVDCKGNAAKDFNSSYFTVFLNDYTTVEPKEGDIYKKVLIKNGVGTADFRNNFASFKTSGNVITAVIPGMDDRVDYALHTQMKVKDSDIPINPSTTLVASKLTTYPLSDGYLSVKLTNSNGDIVANQKITFKFNGKTYTAKTNAKGIAKVKVSLTSKKTYPVTITYAGGDDYKSSSVATKIIVKTGSKKSKITASNMKTKKNVKKTFKLKLTGSGKVLKSQKVIVKVNAKSYTIKTNSKGIAMLSIKLPKVKNYKISMRFLGNSVYKAVSKTNIIKVTK